MANNRNYNNSSGSSLGAIITLVALVVFAALGLGWATSWYTDWTFSKVTETMSELFPSEEDNSGATADGDQSGSEDGDGSSTGDDSGQSSGEYVIYYNGVLTAETFDYDVDFDCVSTANAGERITFTVTVTGDGFLHNIVILGGDDNAEIGFTSLGDDEYTLVMPACDISITLYIDYIGNL